MTSEKQNDSLVTFLYPVSAGQMEIPSGTKNAGPTVGVCLSGGGSRAFTAGIGQLQALQAITANGSSLLSQTTFITTVSGGSWIGIPFTYKSQTLSDADFLGTYVPPASLALSSIGDLPAGGIAVQITRGFSISELAVKAYTLYAKDLVPSNMLWQVLMGIHFLKPFSLYDHGEDWLPRDFFCYTQGFLDAFVLKQNPSLADEVCYLPNPDGRPFVLSMASMSVDSSILPMGQRLVPVMSTPIFTGVWSSPEGVKQHVGGGTVTSFAFNSSPIGFGNQQATVQQTRQWSLTDILGTSSAAFAEELIKEFQNWSASPAYFAAAMQAGKPDAVRRLGRSAEEKAEIEAFIDRTTEAALLGPADVSGVHRAVAELSLPTSIVPQYQYWPVSEPHQTWAPVYDFADGGSLENSGVAAMLATTADVVIAFINSMTPMQRVGQNTVLDTCVPPLFGYQPWDKDESEYLKYGSEYPSKFPVYSNNQVFATEDFQTLQDGLWQANGSGAHTAYPFFVQNLTTVANSWFGVPAGKQVTVVWMYLDVSNDWKKELKEDVRLLLDLDPDLHRFPNFSTDDTGLRARQINLLSNLTAWAVQQNSEVIAKLFS
jgi:Lysophospholipase catalytic domain